MSDDLFILIEMGYDGFEGARREPGNRLVLRLWEVGGRPTTAHVRLPLTPFQTARSASLVEEPQAPLKIHPSAVAAPMRGSGLATVLLQ